MKYFTYALFNDIDPDIFTYLKVQYKIETVEQLLVCLASKKRRCDIARELGIEESVLLKIAKKADLCRISGIGHKICELFNKIGIETIEDLQKAKLKNLLDALNEENRLSGIGRKTPGPILVSNMKKEAAMLRKHLQE